MQPVELNTPFKNILNHQDNINYTSNMNYNEPNVNVLKNNLKPSRIYENSGYYNFGNNVNRNSNNDYINYYIQNKSYNCKFLI